MSGAADEQLERGPGGETHPRCACLCHPSVLVACLLWLPLVVKAAYKLHKSLDPAAAGDAPTGFWRLLVWYPDWNQPPPGWGNDFAVFWQAARDVITGEPLYGTGFMYPPLFACLALPLALLPPLAAGLLWLALKPPLFHYAASVFLPPGSVSVRVRPWLLALSPLLVWRYLDSDIATGNCNVYLLAGLVAAAGFAQCGRARAAAIFAAIVSAVKLSPLYVVAGFAAAGRRRVALTAFLLTIALLVLPTFAMAGGWRATWEGFRDNTLAVGEAPEERPGAARDGYLAGVSVRPILYRWLTDSHAIAHKKERHTINVVDWPRERVETLYRVIAVSLAIAGLWAARGRSLPWTVAWCMVLLLVISPYARKAQFVFLLPACLLALRYVLARGVAGSRGVAAGLILSLALGQLPVPALMGKEWAERLVAAGAPTAAAFAILASLWMVRSET